MHSRKSLVPKMPPERRKTMATFGTSTSAGLSRLHDGQVTVYTGQRGRARADAPSSSSGRADASTLNVIGFRPRAAYKVPQFWGVLYQFARLIWLEAAWRHSDHDGLSKGNRRDQVGVGPLRTHLQAK
jgi:hypothetical protein